MVRLLPIRVWKRNKAQSEKGEDKGGGLTNNRGFRAKGVGVIGDKYPPQGEGYSFL